MVHLHSPLHFSISCPFSRESHWSIIVQYRFWPITWEPVYSWTNSEGHQMNIISSCRRVTWVVQIILLWIGSIRKLGKAVDMKDVVMFCEEHRIFTLIHRRTDFCYLMSHEIQRTIMIWRTNKLHAAFFVANAWHWRSRLCCRDSCLCTGVWATSSLYLVFFAFLATPRTLPWWVRSATIFGLNLFSVHLNRLHFYVLTRSNLGTSLGIGWVHECKLCRTRDLALRCNKEISISGFKCLQWH